MGSRADRQSIDALIDVALAGRLPLPSVRFFDSGALGAGALGAYDASDGGTILLDRALLSDLVALEAVYTKEAERYDMAATNSSTSANTMSEALRNLLFSHSVILKQSILDNGLVAAIIDDHHLRDEEGFALVKAFNHLGATKFNWCNTSDSKSG